MKTPEQSIANGTTGLFFFKGLLPEWEELLKDPDELAIDLENMDLELKDLEGRTCEIISLETYTELGSKDFEYYNIRVYIPELVTAIIMPGVSGLHFERDLTDSEIYDLQSVVNDKLTPDEIHVLHHILLRLEKEELESMIDTYGIYLTGGKLRMNSINIYPDQPDPREEEDDYHVCSEEC